MEEGRKAKEEKATGERGATRGRKENEEDGKDEENEAKWKVWRKGGEFPVGSGEQVWSCFETNHKWKARWLL